MKVFDHFAARLILLLFPAIACGYLAWSGNWWLVPVCLFILFTVIGAGMDNGNKEHEEITQIRYGLMMATQRAADACFMASKGNDKIAYYKAEADYTACKKAEADFQSKIKDVSEIKWSRSEWRYK